MSYVIYYERPRYDCYPAIPGMNVRMTRDQFNVVSCALYDRILDNIIYCYYSAYFSSIPFAKFGMSKEKKCADLIPPKWLSFWANTGFPIPIV